MANPCVRIRRHPPTRGLPVFALFSTRLGCLGSLIVSLIGTAILLVLLGIL